MNGKKLGIVMMALASLALTSSLALARGGDGTGPGAGAGYGPGNCAGYGQMAQLTPEKQAAFQKLHDAYATKTAQMRAALDVKRAELNAVAVAPTPDQAKIDSLSKEIGDLQGKLIAERTQFRIQVSKEIGPNVLGNGYGRGRGFHHRGAGFGPCGGAGF